MTANPPEGAGCGVTGDNDRQGEQLKGFDTAVPNTARMWNYWVGGDFLNS